MTISQKKAAADVEDKLKDLSLEDQSEESEVESPKVFSKNIFSEMAAFKSYGMKHK